MKRPISKELIIVKQDSKMLKVLRKLEDSVENPIRKDTSQKGMNSRGT